MPLPLDESISPGQSGHRTDHQVIADVLNGVAAAGDGDVVTWDDATGVLAPTSRASLAADAAFTGAFAQLPQSSDGIRFVSESGNDSNSGRGWGQAKRTIQAAIDSLPGGWDGGFIKVGAGDFAPFDHDLPNVIIEGSAGIGQDRVTAAGGTRVTVPTGQWGAQMFVGAASESFGGGVLRHITFVADTAGTPLGGVRVGRGSNFLLDNVGATDFLDGKGFYVEGSTSSQYGTLRDCTASMCEIGMDVGDHNGLRILGGLIQYYNGGPAAVPAGTIGIRAAAGSDTLLIDGIVIQFVETGCDLASQYARVGNTRFEAFTTGVILRGTREAVLPGCTFNNSIVGVSGRAVHVTSAATEVTIAPFSHGSLAHPTNVLDEGARTNRADGLAFTWSSPDPISATKTVSVFRIPSHGFGALDRLIRYGEVTVSTAIPSSGSDYWQLQLYRERVAGTSGLGSLLSSTATGWAAATGQPILVASNDNVCQPGDIIRATFTKVGSPAALDRVTVSGVFVPY